MGALFAKVLTSDDISELYERSITLLERKGVIVNHEAALPVLEKGGARVDHTSKLVKFPRELTERALHSAPRSFRMAALREELDVTFPPRHIPFYARPSTGARSYLEEDGRLREITMKDVAEWTRLVNDLKYLDFTALPSPSCEHEMVDVFAYRTVVSNTDKHVWVQPYSTESIKVFIEMALTIAGGREKLEQRPLISMIAPVLSPLMYKEMDVEIVWQCARHGLPIHASSLPIAGGTSPFTMAGSILIAATEILAMLVMAQIFRPGSPVIANGMLFYMDMRRGECFIHTPEALLANVGFVQFVKEAFGIPTHTFGFGTDSHLVDGQSFIERAMHALAISTAGVSILGGAGQLEVATSINPLQLVLDDELAMMLKRETTGMQVNEDTLAWSEIVNLPVGGNFVESLNTLKHCRDNVEAISFNRLNRHLWLERGAKDLLSKARDTLMSIRKRPTRSFLTEDVERELDKIVTVNAR